jgi:DNA-directed RNA polymerase subunit N (RpoN/RPB10)
MYAETIGWPRLCLRRIILSKKMLLVEIDEAKD